MYNRVHDALAEKIPVPDLVVYLQADTDVLMGRIAARDRPYERNIEREYIHHLNQAYDENYTRHAQRGSVLVIDTNQLDYVHHPQHLRWVENRIRQAVKYHPFQPELPLELYDLTKDIGETTNIAARHPEVVAKLETFMQDAYTPSPGWSFGGSKRAKR